MIMAVGQKTWPLANSGASRWCPALLAASRWCPALLDCNLGARHFLDYMANGLSQHSQGQRPWNLSDPMNRLANGHIQRTMR
jgi:hypothetical protein